MVVGGPLLDMQPNLTSIVLSHLTTSEMRSHLDLLKFFISVINNTYDIFLQKKKNKYDI